MKREMITRAEARMAEGWPAAERLVCDGWTCQLDAGVTRRANSVLPLTWQGGDPEAAITRAETLYRGRGLRPIFKISPVTQPADLDARLAQRGYREEGQALVLGRPLAGAEAEPQRPVRLDRNATKVWSEICHGGGPERAVREAIVGRISRPCIFAVAEVGGEAAAAGLGVVLEDLLLITALVTRPAQRRRGAARAIIAALVSAAAERGVRDLILQVEADNPPAQALYAGLGWSELYAYAYRSLL
ncbi:GNAT family N-acetyltransferase [Algihabitans albus]|uniref:GNAT family N-acetyltransferase n=1 Tax=Algihabitans albus TaxID=2164067 RepID=UPI000E5D8E53|nr:GNAT family N-acetyltransferase [Algihabitans albus]